MKNQLMNNFLHIPVILEHNGDQMYIDIRTQLLNINLD